MINIKLFAAKIHLVFTNLLPPYILRTCTSTVTLYIMYMYIYILANHPEMAGTVPVDRALSLLCPD